MNIFIISQFRSFKKQENPLPGLERFKGNRCLRASEFLFLKLNQQKRGGIQAMSSTLVNIIGSGSVESSFAKFEMHYPFDLGIPPLQICHAHTCSCIQRNPFTDLHCNIADNRNSLLER